VTSREIVKASVLFQNPPRIAHSLPAPWQTDFVGAGAGRNPDFVPSRLLYNAGALSSELIASCRRMLVNV